MRYYGHVVNLSANLVENFEIQKNCSNEFYLISFLAILVEFALSPTRSAVLPACASPSLRCNSLNSSNNSNSYYDYSSYSSYIRYRSLSPDGFKSLKFPIGWSFGSKSRNLNALKFVHSIDNMQIYNILRALLTICKNFRNRREYMAEWANSQFFSLFLLHAKDLSIFFVFLHWSLQ